VANPKEVDKLLYSWRLLQQRINSDIPSYANRLKAAKKRVAGWPN